MTTGAPEDPGEPFAALRFAADRFSKRGYEGGASLLAATVPIGPVTGAIVDTLGPAEVVEEASVHSARGAAARNPDPELSPPEPVGGAAAWASVVRLKGEPWTLVLAQGGDSPLTSGEHLGPLALDLSLCHDAEALLVRAVPESPSDPSAEPAPGGAGPRLAWSYELYRGGRIGEIARWAADGALLHFESRQDEPDSGREGASDAGSPVGGPESTLAARLASRGITVPRCCPASVPEEEGPVGLEVVAPAPERIERVDLLRFEEEIPWPEDETLVLSPQLVEARGDEALPAGSDAGGADPAAVSSDPAGESDGPRSAASTAAAIRAGEADRPGEEASAEEVDGHGEGDEEEGGRAVYKRSDASPPPSASPLPSPDSAVPGDGGAGRSRDIPADPDEGRPGGWRGLWRRLRSRLRH